MNPDNPNFRTPEEEARAAELVRLKAEVARQAKQLELAKILYHAAIKMVDRYSKEKFPLNQTVTVEDIMSRYDKELDAIEREESGT